MPMNGYLLSVQPTLVNFRILQPCPGTSTSTFSLTVPSLECFQRSRMFHRPDSPIREKSSVRCAIVSPRLKSPMTQEPSFI